MPCKCPRHAAQETTQPFHTTQSPQLPGALSVQAGKGTCSTDGHQTPVAPQTSSRAVTTSAGILPISKTLPDSRTNEETTLLRLHLGRGQPAAQRLPTGRHRQVYPVVYRPPSSGLLAGTHQGAGVVGTVREDLARHNPELFFLRRKAG